MRSYKEASKHIFLFLHSTYYPVQFREMTNVKDVCENIIKSMIGKNERMINSMVERNRTEKQNYENASYKTKANENRMLRD